MKLKEPCATHGTSDNMKHDIFDVIKNNHDIKIEQIIKYNNGIME